MSQEPLLSPTLQLACELIRRPSVTPADAGCQALMIDLLEQLGFRVQRLRYGNVDNFWAVRGESGPLFAFAGHTDVVPAGREDDWRFPPFEPTLDNGMLYGRGAADMKGSLAAMVTACQRFVGAHSDHPGRIAFLITSDEEGPAVNGTTKVVDWLQEQGEEITWCLVGEPSSSKDVGDIIKNGRRGSLNAALTVRGRQGHVAYPQLAANPIHLVAPALVDLVSEIWDEGNDHFPATTFQVSNFNSGTGTTNVIPGEANILLNFRFSTEVTEADLRSRTEDILDQHRLHYELEWNLSGEPFLTAEGELVEATQQAVREIAGYEATLSTSGGTSDGRFIAPTGAQLVELGPLNTTIHQIDECVRAEHLDTLTSIYERILEKLLLRG